MIESQDMGGRPAARGRGFWKQMMHGSTVVAAVFLVVVVLLTVLAPVFAPYDPLQQDLSQTLQGPGFDHLLGTDHLGRDVLSRIVFAGRISLLASTIAVSVAVLSGVPLGIVAGYFGGWFDRIIMRGTDTVMALPGLILAIAIIAVLGPGLVNAMVALGVVLAPGFVRIARASTLGVREENYVDAARVIGLPARRVILRHVVPNAKSPIIVQTFLTFATALLAEAGLSFIGLGVQPPQASWGRMLSDAATFIARQWFLVLPPGLAISFTVLALNFLGDGLRDTLAPTAVTRSPRKPRRVPRHHRALHAANSDVLLDVENLSIAFAHGAGDPQTVVDGVSFSIQPGEMVALVGESGCGKTVTSLAVVGLVPPPGSVAGRVTFAGRDLIQLRETQLQSVRGREIAMVFQDPVASLDPTFTVGSQIAEPLRRHMRMGRKEARRRSIELLGRVGVKQPEQRIDDYPHQFSGGMAQRAMLAIALACEPRLLIADEPTTALDVTVQADVLDLLRRLQAESGMAVLLITHDLGVVADLCERVLVMYAGQIVETNTADLLFDRPAHPYTEALLDAAQLDGSASLDRLPVIPGSVPSPGAWPAGCRFNPRCAYVVDECRVVEPSIATIDGATAKCSQIFEPALRLRRHRGSGDVA